MKDLKRFLVVYAHRPSRARCCVYAKNSIQAAEVATPCIASILGFSPKALNVFSTYEDGSAKDLLRRFVY